MRPIDADAFKTWIDDYVSVFKKSDKAEIKGYISHQPSIDIVRCKECKYWWRTTGANYGDCNHFRLDTLADAYCSYGERRE